MYLQRFRNGLVLSILSLSEAKEKEVINKVIDVIGVNYNNDYLRISEPVEFCFREKEKKWLCSIVLALNIFVEL